LGVILLILFNVLLAILLIALITVGLFCVRRNRSRAANAEVLLVKEEVVIKEEEVIEVRN